MQRDSQNIAVKEKTFLFILITTSCRDFEYAPPPQTSKIEKVYRTKLLDCRSRFTAQQRIEHGSVLKIIVTEKCGPAHKMCPPGLRRGEVGSGEGPKREKRNDRWNTANSAARINGPTTVHVSIPHDLFMLLRVSPSPPHKRQTDGPQHQQSSFRIYTPSRISAICSASETVCALGAGSTHTFCHEDVAYIARPPATPIALRTQAGTMTPIEIEFTFKCNNIIKAVTRTRVQ